MSPDRPRSPSLSGTRITVLFFAGARDVASRDRLSLDVPAAATVRDVRDLLTRWEPRLAALLERSRIAVDREFASDDDCVGDGAEVAILPPVSGG